MSENKDNRTATQKIEDLEKVVTVLYQTATQNRQAIESLFATQRDMTLVKDALKLLNKKTEAIVQTATPESGITPDSVAALVVKMNVDELIRKQRIIFIIENGFEFYSAGGLINLAINRKQ